MQEEKEKNQQDLYIAASSDRHLARAKSLAGQLDLPVVLDGKYRGPGLKVADDGLTLCLLDDRGQALRVRVDFTSGKWQRRIATIGKEPLIRAMGKKRRSSPGKIIDATGGLGRDSFLLAAAGHEILIYEKEPLLAMLVEDGLQRAAGHPAARAIAARIRLVCGDACRELDRIQSPPDVIYLDPMFPKEKKSARVKKNLQIIRAIAGPCHGDDIQSLFGAALNCRPEQLIVKRPHNSPFLTGKKPAYSIDGPTIRYDIYLPDRS
jgi:16S rRNA (guanine1516-N2)-methyltransferase